VKLKLRHVYATVTVGGILASAVCVFFAIQAIAAGKWLDITVTSSVILLALWVSHLLLPLRPSRAQRSSAMALYAEAERLIFAMTPQRSYCAGDVLLIRMRKLGVARVLRLDMASYTQHFPVLGEMLTLFAPPPLVYRSASRDRVVPTSQDTVTIQHSPRCAGWWGAVRELRLVRKAGAGLLSTDELRTLVEQLRTAEPVQV
jgi:hypothetical protein